jgi:hypothetical protein
VSLVVGVYLGRVWFGNGVFVERCFFSALVQFNVPLWFEVGVGVGRY